MSFLLPYAKGGVFILNYAIQRTVREISSRHYSDGISIRKINAQERRDLWTKIGGSQEFAGLTLEEASPPLFEAVTPEIKQDSSLVDVEAGGKPFQLHATVVSDKIKTPLIWTSSNTEIATVSQDGLVTGLAAGTSLISVKSESGPTATCVVAVWKTDEQGFVRFACDDPALYDWGFAYKSESVDLKLLGGPPLSVVVEKMSGEKTQAFGVRFFQQDSQNFYQLLITTEGKYLLEKKVGGKFAILVPWSDSFDIDTGIGKINTLLISQPSIDSFVISINGKIQNTIQDSSFYHGTTSFFASVGNPYGEFQENLPSEPVDVRFKLTSPLP
jgi:hypothetical protein